MPEILIADDHAVVRHGIRQILAEQIPGAVFSEVSDPASVLDEIRRLSPHLLILDISLPGRSGLDVLREVRDALPRLPILVFSMHSESLYAIRALKAGASGYVSKDAPAGELGRAVQRVLSGGRYVSDALAEILAAEFVEPPHGLPHTALSDREHQVLLALASGRHLSELASELEISAKTLSTYRRRILEKMRLENNAALVRYCLEHNLI